MKLKNYQMDGLLTSLDGIMDKTGVLGYAISRNYRIIRETIVEYSQEKEKLFTTYGEVEKDENGNLTQHYILDLTRDDVKQALAEFNKIAEIEHEIDLYRIPISEAINELTAKQLLELDLMFYDDEPGKEKTVKEENEEGV